MASLALNTALDTQFDLASSQADRNALKHMQEIVIMTI